MNGTRCAISPEMNATSRDKRQSFATTTGAFALFRLCQRFGEPGAAVKGVTALPAFHFDKFGKETAPANPRAISESAQRLLAEAEGGPSTRHRALDCHRRAPAPPMRDRASSDFSSARR